MGSTKIKISYLIALGISFFAGLFNVDVMYAYSEWWYRKSNGDFDQFFAFILGVFLVIISVVLRVLTDNRKIGQFTDLLPWFGLVTTLVTGVEIRGVLLYSIFMIFVAVFPALMIVVALLKGRK